MSARSTFTYAGVVASCNNEVFQMGWKGHKNDKENPFDERCCEWEWWEDGAMTREECGPILRQKIDDYLSNGF